MAKFSLLTMSLGCSSKKHIWIYQVELSQVSLRTNHMLQSRRRNRNVLQETCEYFPEEKFCSSQLALPVGTFGFKFSLVQNSQTFSQLSFRQLPGPLSTLTISGRQARTQWMTTNSTYMCVQTLPDSDEQTV